MSYILFSKLWVSVWWHIVFAIQGTQLADEGVMGVFLPRWNRIVAKKLRRLLWVPQLPVILADT
jgi:hypothetical protein